MTPASQVNSYLASVIAAYLINKLMRHDRSFSFETVMSHISKVEVLKTAKRLGFKTYLYFLFTRSPDFNVLRVRQRISEGGHAVPEEKIRERYIRCFHLLPEALPHCDQVFLFDNSGESPLLVGQGSGLNIQWKDGYFFKGLEILMGTK